MFFFPLLNRFQYRPVEQYVKFNLHLKGTVPDEISCFLDYGQEHGLSLLYYLEIRRNHHQKVIEAKKYELNRQNNG